jgi:hypothetical protein
MTPAFYNHLTHSYETSDKTTVAVEICDGDSLSRGRLPTDGSETQVGESLA